MNLIDRSIRPSDPWQNQSPETPPVLHRPLTRTDPPTHQHPSIRTAPPAASPKVAQLSEEILSLNMLELGQLLKVLKVRNCERREIEGTTNELLWHWEDC